MALDAWLPIGFKLPDGAKARVALFEGADWQILETQGGGRALVVRDALAEHWLDAGLIDPASVSHTPIHAAMSSRSTSAGDL